MFIQQLKNRITSFLHTLSYVHGLHKCQPCFSGRSSLLKRTIFTTKHMLTNYEGDGKTTVSVLNRVTRNLLMINSYSNMGFRLNNGIFVIGPVAIFPKSILQWNVNVAKDITPETLSLFHLLVPKLDILVIGTGDKAVRLDKEALELMKSQKINLEILPTYQAVSTFNFLNLEGRYVAGAFIPPANVVVFEDEVTYLNQVTKADVLGISDH